MSELGDILGELKIQRDRTANLEDLLEEVNGSEEAKENLEYDFNLVGVGWRNFQTFRKDDLVEEAINSLKELLSAVNSGDKDLIREKSKVVASVLQKDN